MKPTNYEKTIGNDFVMNFAFTLNGSPVNITGYKFFLTLKKDRTIADTDPATIKVDGSIVSAAGGTAIATLPASVTKNLDGTYYYDTKYVDNTGVINTYGFGVISFFPRVTIREA
jgi:hypothetical protein